jgi:hypothetical protein
MITDEEFKRAEWELKESQDDANELASRQVRNVIKLRMMKREKLRTWGRQIGILS